MFVYDWDKVLLADNTTAFAYSLLSLCTGYLPCVLHVSGDGAVDLSGDAQLACLASAGCLRISINTVDFTCRNNTKSVFQMQGSVLIMFKASFVGCRSDTDGGVVQAYNLAKVVIQSCNFTNVHTSGFGGAVAAYGSSLSITDSRLHNCSSRSGGGAVWASAFPDCFATGQANNTYLRIMASIFSLCSTGCACCTRQPALLNFQQRQAFCLGLLCYIFKLFFVLICLSRWRWRCCLGQLASVVGSR